MLPDTGRLRSVKRFLALNLNVEEDLQGILTIASQICDTPIALITLLDDETQWMRVRQGTDVTEMPRSMSFCDVAVRMREMVVVPDLSRDIRFADNELVTGEKKLRFYAGSPLVDSHGNHLGTLCIVDSTPRTLTEKQINTLRLLSKQAMRLMELKLSLRLLEKRNQRIEKQNERINKQTAALQEIAFIQSHEVRSPVASILGLVNLIQIDGAASATEYLPMLQEAANMLDTTIHKTVRQTRRLPMGEA